METSILYFMAFVMVAGVIFMIVMMMQDRKKSKEWFKKQEGVIAGISKRLDDFEFTQLEKEENNNGRKVETPVSSLVAVAAKKPEKVIPPVPPTVSEQITDLLKIKPLATDVIIERLLKIDPKKVRAALNLGPGKDAFIKDDSGLWSNKG